VLDLPGPRREIDRNEVERQRDGTEARR
jgi:hypothetical protein